MQKLYDSDAQLLGYVAAAAGRQTLYDRDFRLLGYYFPATDKTYDADMRLIGRGNLLTRLVPVQTE